MGTEIFFQSLGLPTHCAVGSTVFKKFFYNIGLSSRDKKLITNQVEKIVIQYNLTSKNINIQAYSDEEREYLEVQVLEARLHNDKNHKRVAEIIMRAILYPVILQISLKDRFKIVVGMPRVNLADRDKQTIDEFVFSPWVSSVNVALEEQEFLKKIHASKLSNLNFYNFYKDFVDQVHLLNAASLVKVKLTNLSPAEAKAIHAEIGKIEAELLSLRSLLKKEDMFNRKVELNVQIKTLEEKHQNLLEGLQKQ